MRKIPREYRLLRPLRGVKFFWGLLGESAYESPFLRQRGFQRYSLCPLRQFKSAGEMS
jgi:hypothetical protein